MIRFTIRDLMWLTLAVALGSGWGAEHRRFTPEDREILRVVKSLGFQKQLHDPIKSSSSSASAAPSKGTIMLKN